MEATTLSEVIHSINDRMAKFEGELLKSSSLITVEAIAADYAAFKTFTVSVLKAIQQQVTMLARDADQQEMRSRRKILLLHGVSEESKEDTAVVVAKTISTQLKLTFSQAHISRCHRMGRASNSDRPRPILVKMRDVATRDQVWFAKTNLKGSNITLSEFLTKPRHNAFMQARELFGVKNCWTRDGHIHIITPGGVRHRISSVGELSKLMPSDAQKPAHTAKATTAAKDLRPPSTRLAAAKGASKK